MDQETLAAVRDTIERFYREHQPMEERVARYTQGHREETEVWETMAMLGWLGLSLPEELEGFNATAGQCLDLTQLAGRDARPENLAEHWLLAPFLLSLVNPQERAPLASSLSTGTRRIGLVDVSHALVAEGNELHGEAGIALGNAIGVTDWLVPFEDEGHSHLAWVEATSTGIVLSPARLLDGRECRLISFDRTAYRELESGANSRHGQQALDLAAAAQFADSVGSLEAAFDLTLDYLKQRRQFGQPLSRLQAVQQLMADVFCDLQQAITFSRRLSLELHEPSPDTERLIAAAKSFLGRRMLRAFGKLIQVSGGIGMTEEYRIAHYYKRAQVAATLYGDAESQLRRVDPRTALLAA